MSIRVLLADDHAIVRQGLRALLEKEGIEVVDEVSDGRQAVQSVRDHEPDVAVLDAVFKGSQTTGIDVMHQLVNAGTNVSFIILSPCITPTQVFHSYGLRKS